MTISVNMKVVPPLDPGFVPAVLWNRAFDARVAAGVGEPLAIALERPNGSISVFHTRVLPHSHEHQPLNERYVERLFKFLLWQRGGNRVTVAGAPHIAHHLRSVYGPSGSRRFDFDFMGDRVYREPLTIEPSDYAAAPEERQSASAVGRHLDGCRIGFDLGGSDRKCSAIHDGIVVHTEEVVWDPYFQSDPDYHFQGILDSIQRAAAKLPRVDAIGASAAGVYVENEVRVASLFRGVPPELFEQRVRRMFFDLQTHLGGVPLVVANDGDVTALAGSMSLGVNGVLGISMGTSQAGGYVTQQGKITDWLNELAFAPVDYRADAPVDEWSGDGGCGAQYFSQQAIARLLPAAGIDVPDGMPLAERLAKVQELLTAGDSRAVRVFETVGVYLGYAVAHYADFYDVNHVLVLGRVTSGAAGDIILTQARTVLETEFPALATSITLHLPDEQDKRHGQAVAAASLPALRR